MSTEQLDRVELAGQQIVWFGSVNSIVTSAGEHVHYVSARQSYGKRDCSRSANESHSLQDVASESFLAVLAVQLARYQMMLGQLAPTLAQLAQHAVAVARGGVAVDGSILVKAQRALKVPLDEANATALRGQRVVHHFGVVP